ncbi:MAG: DUF2911 domain-containing protein [Rhodothermales bacterium]|nr:DUF2911 domain-containing protein [Rhodothermales bacterium]
MFSRTLRRLAGLTMLAALLLAVAPAYAQRDNSQARPSPNAMLSQTIGTTTVDLHYSRPGVKGRTVYGDLVPYGRVWRAGANEPTTITFGGDVIVGGETLPAGTYNLFVEPQEAGDWAVIFHEPVRWGTMHDAEKEVLRVSATPQEAPMQEWLQYRFEDLTDTSATLVLHWADRALPIVIATAQ